MILTKNINVKSFLRDKTPIFINFDNDLLFKKFRRFIQKFFSGRDKYNLKILDNLNINDIYENAFKLVQFGWKKEAVPVVHEKKSIISRLLELFFK